jgi:NADPH:quinone reductase-like Zn-dependent oxidoreductase
LVKETGGIIMKQIWISKAGDVDVLKVKEAPDPSPSDDEVLIDVKCSGINFADILARMGMYPDAPPIPCVVGYEVSGIVEKVGKDVTQFKEGDRVFALTRFGGYSTKVLTKEIYAMSMPDEMSFEEGAALPVNYLTAYLGVLYMGNLKQHERILIHSAGGGVGLASIQLAKWVGAEIFGTASYVKHDYLKSIGVHHTIDYRSQDFEEEVKRITGGKGVHLIMDAIGGEYLKKDYRILSPLGRIITFGVSGAVKKRTRSIITLLKTVFKMPKFKPLSLLNKNRGVFGLNIGHLWNEREALNYVTDKLLTLYNDGKIKPHIDSVFPFDKIRDAHKYIQERKNIGKVLLSVQ